MALDVRQRTPLMAITLDDRSRSHLEQTSLLLGAGVRWIQLRQKAASALEKETVARTFVALCREGGAVSIINDSVDMALLSQADGVHLGRLDGDWVAARRALGPERILGGTINDADDAARAQAAGVLDYVGVGPWRFTHSKAKLSPVLGAPGIAPLLKRLHPLPAWVIGGIKPPDAAEIRQLGAAGVAVSSGVVLATSVADAVSEYLSAWN